MGGAPCCRLARCSGAAQRNPGEQAGNEISGTLVMTAPGQLQHVLTPFEPEAIPVNIIFLSNPKRRSPVRGFWVFLDLS
jgi:hypothetical protein